MKSATLLPVLTLVTAHAFAQDVQALTSEQTEKIARKLVEIFGTPADAAFAVDADATKAAGLKAGSDGGLVAIPDRKLTGSSFKGTGAAAMPVGQLWMRNLVPVVNGNAPDAEKLRPLSVPDKEGDVKVDAFLLGVLQGDAQVPQLGIFGKGGEAVMKVPLIKTNAAANEIPIALAGYKEGEKTGMLVMTFFGSYKADILVTRPR